MNKQNTKLQMSSNVVWVYKENLFGIADTRKPWHVPMLEIHCTGFNRNTYDQNSPHYRGGYNNAFNRGVGHEFWAKQRGLVITFGLN